MSAPVLSLPRTAHLPPLSRLLVALAGHSSSIVPGGLEVQS